MQKYLISNVKRLAQFYKFVKTQFYILLRLFRKYRLVIRFIFIFLGSYFLLSSLYSGFLVIYDTKMPVPDPFTQLVARQSGEVLASLGYQVNVVMHNSGLSMMLMVEDIFLAGIVEGCNSISIIILFASFVLSFFGRVSTTLLFLFAGSVIVYVMNIFRIVILSMGLYHYPEYSHYLHTLFFPLAIYGTVFILWIVWVQIYSQWRKQ